jgi:hypothetical protein
MRLFGTASVLALASAVVWFAIIRRRRASDGGLAAVLAGVALTGVFAVMFALPWRLYAMSQFEPVLFESARCFVVSKSGPRVLLLCPWSPHARSRIVEAGDRRLMPYSSPPGNVFDAVFSGR